MNKYYEGVIFINNDNTVDWMYYNPDSVSGGQYVQNHVTFEQINVAAQKCKSKEAFFDFLESESRQYLYDKGTFASIAAEEQLKSKPDLIGLSDKSMKKLIEIAGEKPALKDRIAGAQKKADEHNASSTAAISAKDQGAR